MKYRSRTDITGLILEAANGGATKTKIMYKAYLSFAQLREYLSMLLEKGLIDYVEGRAIYKTTENGIRLLQMCNQMNEELVVFDNIR
ncbi:MAG: winged helix-turn-helix domain-containing protein [Nitrososphaeraceae archaeon]